MTISRITFRTSVSAVVLAMALCMALPQAALAEECFTDFFGVDGATSTPNGTTLACGPNTNANGVGATAVGNDQDGNGVGTSAIGLAATAVGGDAFANANFATAVGADGGQNGVSGATASGLRSSAFGVDAEATAAGATAIGDAAVASGANSLSIGGRSDATQNGATAIGGDNNGNGLGAQATGTNSTAVGADSLAVTGLSSAFGVGSIANANVFGDPLQVNQRATAIGAEARAENNRATAVGAGAVASGNRSTALGTQAVARGGGSVAIGDNAETGTPGVGAQNAVAIGRNANAQAAGSVAIGADNTADPTIPGSGAATATQENQFVLGTARHTYTAPGITSDLSRDRQSGPLELVTTDANGNLASDNGQIFRELGKQGAGIAIATAMENPDLVGNETFGLAANIGFFEGNSAIAVSAMGVLGRDFMGGGERWAVSGGVGVSLNENEFGGQGTDRTVAGRAGVQVSW